MAVKEQERIAGALKRAGASSRRWPAFEAPVRVPAGLATDTGFLRYLRLEEKLAALPAGTAPPCDCLEMLAGLALAP
jgi:hypothetical protein